MRHGIFVLLAACLAQAAPSDARVCEGKLDPIPPVDFFATTRFLYPYTLRENLTGKSSNIAWRAIYLENEYLKCSVVPDPGGHLYTCVLLGSLDKRCGSEKTAERFRHAAQATGSADLYWANLAARELPGFDQPAWFGKMQAALVALEANSEGGSWSLYVLGTLSRQIGAGRAGDFFRSAFSYPDVRMAHHLSYLALSSK